MKVRGIYTIEQADRRLREEDIRAKAQVEIAAQITEMVHNDMSPNIIKEEPSPKYPFGRYYLDLEINSTVY